MLPNANSPFSSDNHFETEVRRIARLIWPSAKVDRSPLIDGLERDAVVQTPDIIFVVEATTSRKKDKIAGDAKKTSTLVKKIRSQGFSAKGLLVTLNEPTADQEAEAKSHASTLQIQSFDEFLSRLFDAPQYLHARLDKPFGSIQNPKDFHFSLGREFYIPIPIVSTASAKSFSAVEIAEAIETDSARFAVLADFGSGKSMSLREIFYLLRDAFISKRHSRFPIYINLRDHSGAKYPDEILERHARDIGLSDFIQLVKAWRGGFVDLLLDGFDEFAAIGWSSQPFKLRQLRRLMLEAVRRLISESPKTVGIVLAGRQHYFDSDKEMTDALSIGNRFDILHIDALSEEDANKIVKKYGGDSVPDWVPSRALLLSYLAAKNFLKDMPSFVSGMKSRGHGWDTLLEMICDREANQHPALQGPEVLMFLERLATLARNTSDGLGAFSESDLSAAFEIACGFPPDDSARILISRLPALASMAAESGKRRFIDIDIADAARAGDDFRFLDSPYDPTVQTALKEAQVAIGENGLDRLSYIAEKNSLQAAKIEIAIEVASKARNSILALDGLQLMMDWNLDFGRPGIDLMDIQISSMSLDEDIPDLSRIRFIECIVDSIYISPSAPVARLPRFERCLIGSLDGVATRGDLPKSAFLNCDIDQIRNSMARNATILDTDLPVATKVLLTVLNKLFNQAGRGRKENAFHRGLEARARALVPSILELVSTFGFATPTRIRQQTIWMPRRDKNRRVFDILDHPNTSTDALLTRVRNL